MDRNAFWKLLATLIPEVALRKESVDRNRALTLTGDGQSVALRKESVDRNAAGSWRLAMNLLSLSARRAWIEISRSPFAMSRLVRRSPQGERG